MRHVARTTARLDKVLQTAKQFGVLWAARLSGNWCASDVSAHSLIERFDFIVDGLLYFKQVQVLDRPNEIVKMEARRNHLLLRAPLRFDDFRFAGLVLLCYKRRMPQKGQTGSCRRR